MELDSAKAVSPKGEGRPFCSWTGPAAALKGQLATKQSPTNSNPTKGQTMKGGQWWGCCVEDLWSSLAHSDGAR